MNTKYVAGAVIIKDQKVLTTQRGYGDYKGYWEFPGGKVEPGETPEEAIIREIREELACEIDVLGDVGLIEYDYPEFHLSMQCLHCRLMEGEIPKLLEHEAARWLSADEIYDVKWLPADLSILEHIKGMLLMDFI